MRVGVLFGGTAVGSPAGMADSETAVDRIEPDGLFQVAQLALRATDGQLAVVAVNGQPRGVISAIFQALQPVQDNRYGLVAAYITYNSAHKSIINDGGVFPHTCGFRAVRFHP